MADKDEKIITAENNYLRIKNVTVSNYTQLGFDKLDEGYIEFKGDRYYNYNMKRNIQNHYL